MGGGRARSPRPCRRASSTTASSTPASLRGGWPCASSTRPCTPLPRMFGRPTTRSSAPAAASVSAPVA
eukprot:7392684-Alexandrium_andersonii.AAC.1